MMDDTNAVEWGVAQRARHGEAVSGDNSVAAPTATGVLLAVADGLGHGPEAAHAATIAVQTMSEYGGDDVVAVVRACHEALRHTRGAAISVAAVSTIDRTITWLGIGNVAGTMASARPTIPLHQVSLPVQEGVVGWRLPPLQPTTVDISRGDVLVVATDGVTVAFPDAGPLVGSASRIADELIANHSRGDDDALALVVRYRGSHR